MKNSVNGKTFDEIFEQRGRKVSVKKMVIGNVYFYPSVSNNPWAWIFILKSIDIENHDVMDSFSVDDEGYTCDKNSSGFADSVIYYKATPDQIALLNSYKQ